MINNKFTKLFLINASSIPAFNQFNQLEFYKDYYNKTQFEFIINENLQLLECTQLSTATTNHNYKEYKINNLNEIHNILFKLNHVRINPMLNNHLILNILSLMLIKLGLNVENLPKQDSLKICFQPLGKIKENIRFYINNNNQAIFLPKNTYN